MSARVDERVDPMRAREFVAAVQHAAPGDRPALLRLEFSVGHGEGRPPGEQIAEIADECAFLFDELGMK